MLDKDKPCGPEMILDLYECDESTFTKESLEQFFIEFCECIDMERVELHIWEYLEDPNKDPEELEHLKGYSAIQFIKTSSVLIHVYSALGKVSLNVYSCKPYDSEVAKEFCKNWFGGKVKQHVDLIRY